MRVLRTFDELPPHAYLAIGVFDGVHLGHQRVISQARDDANEGSGASVVVTFDPHPMHVLQPDKAPVLLTSTPHKLLFVEQLQVDACVVVNFDKEFSQISAERFIQIIGACREICVGTRFRFGHDRLGDVRLLERLAPSYGFVVKEIKSVLTANGEMISSTALRTHVLSGNLQRAAAMLGRPFSVLGTVIRGDRVGHQLGFPTANLDPHDEALPPNGVYAVRVRIGSFNNLEASRIHPGVVNIGLRPTFENRPHQRTLEVHIFDFQGDIYGQDLEVGFVQKLRDEKKFESPAKLKAQIGEDLKAARNVLSCTE